MTKQMSLTITSNIYTNQLIALDVLLFSARVKYEIQHSPGQSGDPGTSALRFLLGDLIFDVYKLNTAQMRGAFQCIYQPVKVNRQGLPVTFLTTKKSKTPYFIHKKVIYQVLSKR